MNLQNYRKGLLAVTILFFASWASGQAYKIVDTRQGMCYDTAQPIGAPVPGSPFYGQDAQHNGAQPAYQDNGNGTVTDLVTGLMWQQGLLPDKYIYDEALAGADTFSLAGYNDWRLPTIKELYSLILFDGYTGISAAASSPYLDTNYFEFRYGNEAAGERFIDAQYASGTEYTGTTMNGAFTIFGVNFADGRIKGYGTGPLPGQTTGKLFEVKYVRGNPSYGINNFHDNGDGTVSDSATGLMWTQNDNGSGLDWEDALSWVQQKNSQSYLGYNDWRLPNAKELQSIVDYSRSIQATFSAAIDPLFLSTAITDEGGNTNYPFYWTGTTHADGPPGQQYTKAVYLCFGEALGFMEIPPQSGNYILMDVHGAGAQRSDPKTGDPANFPNGFGPQGDVIRIFNYVRMVRDEATNPGLNEIPGEGAYGVYPNPAGDYVVLRYPESLTEGVDVTITDILGRNYVCQEISYPGGLMLRTAELGKGMYFLSVRSASVAHTVRFLKK